MSSGHANRRGIICMVAAMGCYVLNDALVKLTLDVFPPGEVLAVRGVVAGCLTGCLALRVPRPAARLLWQPITALRAVLEITTALASVLALSRASLPLVSAVMMTAPLMVVSLSMALGWEAVRAVRVATILAGLAGAGLVLRPSPQADASGLCLASLCAVSLACRDLVTRRLPRELASIHVAFVATAAVCIAGAVIGLVLGETWVTVVRRETLALVAAAVFSAAGNLALVVACRGTDLSIVTPFRYSIIMWSCMLSYTIWQVLPDTWTLIGITIIVLAGLLSLIAA